MLAEATLRELWPQSRLLLSTMQLDHGLEVVGSDTGAACARSVLRNRQRPLSIAAIGGSITAGSSFTTSTGSAAFLYHQKVLSALNFFFRAPQGHLFKNGGVPGTGPTYMEHCVHDHMPSKPDVILVEYAVNTDHNPAAFERLLRRLLLLPHAPALIVVNAHRWRTIRPVDGRTDKCWHHYSPLDLTTNKTQWLAQTWGNARVWADPASFDQVADALPNFKFTDSINSDEDAIADLCRHYNVPLVSLRSAVMPAVRTGRLHLPDFMHDCKHPNGAGHTFLAQLVSLPF